MSWLLIIEIRSESANQMELQRGCIYVCKEPENSWIIWRLIKKLNESFYYNLTCKSLFPCSDTSHTTTYLIKNSYTHMYVFSYIYNLSYQVLNYIINLRRFYVLTEII